MQVATCNCKHYTVYAHEGESTNTMHVSAKVLVITNTTMHGIHNNLLQIGKCCPNFQF